MYQVDNIQDGWLIRVKCDVKVSIFGRVQVDDASLDRGTGFDHVQAVLFVDMIPEGGVTLISGQFERGFPWIAKSPEKKERDCREHNGHCDARGSGQT